MSQLPVIKTKATEKLLLKLGFKKAAAKGNHAFYRHEDGRSTTLPLLRGTRLAPPLLKEILKEIQVNWTTFNELAESASGKRK